MRSSNKVKIKYVVNYYVLKFEEMQQSILAPMQLERNFAAEIQFAKNVPELQTEEAKIIEEQMAVLNAKAIIQASSPNKVQAILAKNIQNQTVPFSEKSNKPSCPKT